MSLCGTEWSQEAKLLTSGGPASLAIRGNTAVIGASGDDVNGTSSGSAYVFMRNGTEWSQEAKLLASDGAAYDGFGRRSSVAISGNMALIGAPGNDDACPTSTFCQSGSAYVYHFPDIQVLPVCDIEMSHGTYSHGDTVTASTLRFSNFGTDPIAVEWKAWIEVPSDHPLSILNSGADGWEVLAAGEVHDHSSWPLFYVDSNWPLGDYEFNCRILDPVTGKLLSEDLNAFQIVP